MFKVTTTYLAAFFEKHLVVLTQSHAEDNRCDIFETVNPFLPLTPLASNVEHAEHKPLVGEGEEEGEGMG